MAESPWTDTPMPNSEVPALTCYRRNLFKITGLVYIPRDAAYVTGPEGYQGTVGSISVEISASESLGGSFIKIVSIPPKSDASLSPAFEMGPNPIKLDIEGNWNQHADPCPFPVFWERLQFRTATAKNNRRSALQQHYFVTMKVIATLDNDSKVELCVATSSPIIVRGRSPRSYQLNNVTAKSSEYMMSEKPASGNTKDTREDHASAASGSTVSLLQPLELYIDETSPDAEQMLVPKPSESSDTLSFPSNMVAGPPSLNPGKYSLINPFPYII